MRKRWIYIVLAVLVLIIGYQFLPFHSGRQKPGNGDQPKSVLRVKAMIVRADRAKTVIRSIGTLTANESVMLKPEVSGRIDRIGFKEGKAVEAGDLLVKLYDADLQAELSKLELRRKRAADNEYRQRKLLEKNGISRQEYEDALNDLDLILADIRYTKAKIEKTEIRAPFSGVMGLRRLSPGSYLSAGTDIAWLVNTDFIKIETRIPEEFAAQVGTGDTLEFRLRNTQTWTRALIYAVEPQVNSSSASILVKARLDNTGKGFIPGLSADIQIGYADRENTVYIPSWALIPDIEGQKVYCYRNGQAQEQRVHIGHRDSRRIEIIDGLDSGDTLIISGILQLRPGLTIDIDQIESPELQP